MIEYLINVVLASASYWMFAFVIFIIGFVYRKRIGDLWSEVKVIAGVIFFFGLFVGLSSPSNTFKNEVDYNRVQDQRQIESYRENDTEYEIVDRTRKPLTEDELKEQSVDMRERVENVE